MLMMQSFAVYQLLRPVTLRPPKIRLPDEQIEPLEFEINLAPDAPAAAAAPDSASTAPSSAPAQQNPGSTPSASPMPTSQASVQATPVLTASAMTRATPAPQPLLAIEATPAPSAPQIVLVPSVAVAAESTTEQPAEEKGAVDGAPVSADADSTPVRPLAITANAAPDRVAAAPISILPGVQVPIIAPIIAATSAVPAPESLAKTQPDLRVDIAKPELSEITVPQPAVDVSQPMRIKPDIPKPDLRVEQSRPSNPAPSLPRAAHPIVTRADVASNADAAKPNLQIDQAKPSRITPVAPSAQAARPVLEISRADSRVAGALSPRSLQISDDDAARPNLAVAPPIAVDAAQSDANTPDANTLDANTPGANTPGASQRQGQDQDSTGSGMPTAGLLGNGNQGLPADPFANGNGAGDRDPAGQGDTSDHRNEFRRYHDPFADDAPNPLVGLRLREPQLFSDISHFLVQAFGPAALGFAVGASSEIDDFSGPNAGILIEKWIQQHHSDLQRECRLQQDTMDEHVRRLLCGER